MTGTILNIVTVLVGGVIGLFFGARIPDNLKKTIVAGLSLFTAAIGVQMFMKTNNSLIVVSGLVIGTLLGEWWKIEDGLQNMGHALERRFARDTEADTDSRFVRGFLTASLLFCVGPLTILGSINDGLRGDYSLLAVKSVLDGFASLFFSSTLGIGVLFSSVVILVYQGGLSLLSHQLSAFLSDPMVAEMTATGGVILLGLAISSMLELKKIRVGNFLPALFVSPLIVWLLAQFRIH